MRNIFIIRIIKYFHMEVSCLDWFSAVVFQKKYAVVYNYIFLPCHFLKIQIHIVIYYLHTLKHYHLTISSFLFLLSRAFSWSFLYISTFICFFTISICTLPCSTCLLKCLKYILKLLWRLKNKINIQLIWYWQRRNKRKAFLVPIFRML